MTDEKKLLRTLSTYDPTPLLKSFDRYLPEIGEVYPFGDKILFPKEPYDDGGGAVVCRARFAR